MVVPMKQSQRVRIKQEQKPLLSDELQPTKDGFSHHIFVSRRQKQHENNIRTVHISWSFSKELSHDTSTKVTHSLTPNYQHKKQIKRRKTRESIREEEDSIDGFWWRQVLKLWLGRRRGQRFRRVWRAGQAEMLEIDRDR